MRSAAKSVRPSKRDVIVIDDDDSINEQPITKNVKREEEPVPSPQVVELQQKVLKLEDNFQRACRAARAAELRAEAAESRLDAKYGIKDSFNAEKKRADEFEKRVNDLSIVLDAERQQADTNRAIDRSRIDELTQKLDQYERGLHPTQQIIMQPQQPPSQLHLLLPPPPLPPPPQLLQQQEQQKKRTDELEMRLAVVLTLLEEERQKVSELTGQKIDLSKQLADRSELKERNDELTQRVAQYEEVLQPLLQLQQLALQLPQTPHPQPQKHLIPRPPVIQASAGAPPPPSTSASTAAAAANAPPSNGRVVLHAVGHPTNLFQLCHPLSGDSMLLNKAYTVLTAAYELDRKLFKQHGSLVKDLALNCQMCNKHLNTTSVVQHFLSPHHQKRVQSVGGAVSRDAVSYWTDKLTRVGQRKQQQQSAADAAATKVMPPTGPAPVAVKPIPTTHPNQCVRCRKIFSGQYTLQMHKRTHTGECPFKCKFCQRTFMSMGNLKTHMRTHRGPFRVEQQQNPAAVAADGRPTKQPTDAATAGVGGLL